MVILSDPPQAIVKFLGSSNDRVTLQRPTIDEIQWTGCHWALAYPRNRRPRSVQQGALMFISRFVEGPDIHVFGQATALKHQPGRDDATDAETQRRPQRRRYPHYIRIHNAQFVAGTLENGVSLYQLMDTLKSDSFVTTQQRAAHQKGNPDPRYSLRQQPHVRLSNEGFHWLNTRLQNAFDIHGTVPQHDLRQLDWPEPPATAAQTS